MSIKPFVSPVIRLIGTVLIAYSMSAVSACDLTEDGHPITQGQLAVASAAATTNLATPCAAPLRVALLIDKSGSATTNIVVQPTAADLQPLIDRLRSCGGELAVGSIRNRSVAPLIRLRLDAREIEPACVHEDRSAMNPMLRLSRDDECAAKQREYTERLGKDDAEAAQRIGTFLRALKPLLEEAPRATRTDLWTAIAQANAFLADPVEPAPRKALILVSDALNTAKTPPVAPISDATIYICNELGQTGALGARAMRASNLAVVWDSLTQPVRQSEEGS